MPTYSNILNVIEICCLYAGDISYAVGYGAQWDEFHDQVSAISTRLPYMTCIGNHERDFPNSGSRYNGSDSGGTCPTLCPVFINNNLFLFSIYSRILFLVFYYFNLFLE